MEYIWKGSSVLFRAASTSSKDKLQINRWWWEDRDSYWDEQGHRSWNPIQFTSCLLLWIVFTSLNTIQLCPLPHPVLLLVPWYDHPPISLLHLSSGQLNPPVVLLADQHLPPYLTESRNKGTWKSNTRKHRASLHSSSIFSSSGSTEENKFPKVVPELHHGCVWWYWHPVNQLSSLEIGHSLSSSVLAQERLHVCHPNVKPGCMDFHGAEAWEYSRPLNLANFLPTKYFMDYPSRLCFCLPSCFSGKSFNRLVLIRNRLTQIKLTIPGFKLRGCYYKNSVKSHSDETCHSYRRI